MNMLIVTEFSLLSIYLLPLNSEYPSSLKSSASSQMKRPKSSPSSEISSASSQMKWRKFSLLYFSYFRQTSQPQANLNESSQNLSVKLCRVKLTLKEEEKLLLIQRHVLVWDMVPVLSFLSPCPNSLVELPFRGDLRQCLPGLKSTLFIIHYHNEWLLGHYFNNYLRRIKTQFPVRLVN